MLFLTCYHLSSYKCGTTFTILIHGQLYQIRQTADWASEGWVGSVEKWSFMDIMLRQFVFCLVCRSVLGSKSLLLLRYYNETQRVCVNVLMVYDVPKLSDTILYNTHPFLSHLPPNWWRIVSSCFETEAPSAEYWSLITEELREIRLIG